MNKIYINGRFLTQKITGVQRYAIEITKAIDCIIASEKKYDKYKFFIVMPNRFCTELGLQNIETLRVGNFTGHLWEQVELPRYTKDGFLINLCNCAPLLKKNEAITIHDAATEIMPKSFSWKFRIWYKFMYFVLSKRLGLFFTVSRCSKEELSKYFSIPCEKTYVTYNGTEHIKNIVPDYSVIEKHNIVPKRYILCVSSLNPSKNFSIVLKVAEKMSNFNFVIVGGKNNKIFNNNIKDCSPNVNFLGYVSDSELMALYENASCFLYPSLYEGFGIPPMEALAFKCPIVLSDLKVFKEIYSNNAIYCDPNSVDDIIKGILTVGNKKIDYNYVDKFLWKNSAETMLDRISCLLSK